MPELGDKSKISWTDASWNPTTGCSKVSEGCRNCYAEQLAPRLAAMGQTGAYTDLPWTKQNAPENVRLHEDRLEMPLRWKRPRRVFVNSMSDLFHEFVPFEFAAEVFRVMAGSQRHTFQILTKRPERMASFVNGAGEFGIRSLEKLVEVGAWPLPNVWLGTSVEDQRAADERIPHLLRTPAAVRFLSCEPLIGPVDLTNIPYGTHILHGGVRRPVGGTCLEDLLIFGSEGDYERDRVHWVIAGGESGPNHRPLDHAWIRSLRDQCEAAGVAFWAKQDSGPRSEVELPEDLRVRQFPEAAGSGA